jgi:hypothetical protein
LRLLTGTELADEFRISPALAMALPITRIEDIPRYIAAMDANESTLNLLAEGTDELSLDSTELVQE